jgi:hypothetical protein
VKPGTKQIKNTRIIAQTAWDETSSEQIRVKRDQLATQDMEARLRAEREQVLDLFPFCG